MSRFLLPLTILAASVAAQTTTTCQPLNSTCPANPALGTTLEETYNASTTGFSSSLWTFDAGEDLVTFSADGAELPLASDDQTITIQSNFYIMFGTVEMIFKAAPGTGIISTSILLSDDLDEIDIEIKGANTTTISNNYYGWGNTSQFNSEYPTVADAQTEYYNYTVDWNKDRIEWLINGTVVRTVPYAAPGLYPQTPCRIQFGVWCGGCSKAAGTVEWAGGKPDWDNGPYTMYVKSMKIVDGTQNATSYTYDGHSGSYSSIQIKEGESAAAKVINKKTSIQSAEATWDNLSTGAKIGIGAGVGSAVFVAVCAFFFYCMKQRKAGRAEAALNEEKWAEQNAELMEYRSMMAQGNFAVSRDSILMEGKPGFVDTGRRFSRF